MATYFSHLTVNFNLHTVTNLWLQRTDFIKYTRSPLKFKLRPRYDIYLDLRLDIHTPETLESWLNLLPSLKRIGLHIENDDWVENITKDNTIQLHILNRSFNHTIDVKKIQCIGFIFLLGEQGTDSITTKYNLK